MVTREPQSAAQNRSGACLQQAFTLVEVLVVIGIIAMLLGILLPAMSRAISQSRLAACKSNLRQIVLAHEMYRNMYRDAKPPLYQKKTLTVYTLFASPDVKWNGKVVGQGILVEQGLLPLSVLMCPTPEIVDDVAMDTAHWANNSLVRSGSSYVYFYRWGDPNLTATNFTAGVTYNRCAMLGYKALVMDISAEEGHQYSGEYEGHTWISHGQLRRMNVGYSDGSVQDYPADEVMLKFPAGTFEVLQWFGEADAKY